MANNNNPGFGRRSAAWLAIFVLLAIAAACARAGPLETNDLSSSEASSPEANAADDGEGDSWSMSAGGWLSFGGWSSSWKSVVSGTRSMFRLTFGGAGDEDDSREGDERGGRCEWLTMEACRDLGYNATSMPNPLNHESQDVAAVELRQYEPFLQANCSADTALFLCSLHAPRCAWGRGAGEEEAALLPCRPLCERVKSRCGVVAERFGLTWPRIFECGRYPDPEDPNSRCTGQ